MRQVPTVQRPQPPIPMGVRGDWWDVSPLPCFNTLPSPLAMGELRESNLQKGQSACAGGGTRERVRAPRGPSYAIVPACVRFSCTSAPPFIIKCCHSVIETAAFSRQPQRMGCPPPHKDTPGPKECVKLVGECKPFSWLRGLTAAVTVAADIVVASQDK